jgi:hypothetical protein
VEEHPGGSETGPENEEPRERVVDGNNFEEEDGEFESEDTRPSGMNFCLGVLDDEEDRLRREDVFTADADSDEDHGDGGCSGEMS